MDGSLSTLSGVFAQRYSIEKTIGRGATASVYLARDTTTDRPVAIKVLRPELAETLGGARFIKEIKLTQGFHHPRILPLLDSGEFEGRLYLVLPYMDGGTLRERLQRERQLPLKEAVDITCTIADALAHAHARGFVHRDVKPENILFSNGEACLADFGIARAIEKSLTDTTTSTGIARGTPAYMSPEQASGAHEYDGRSDIYSLGCVLYEMVSGMQAFLGPTSQAVIAQRFMHAPRELSVYRSGIPRKLAGAIYKALQLAPADRFKTSKEFAGTLRCITPADYAEAERETKWWRQVISTRGRRLGLATSIVALVAILSVTSERVWAVRHAAIPPDTTRIVLFPIEGGTARVSAWDDEDLLRQGLTRWHGLQVVDAFQVSEALQRNGHIQSAERASAITGGLSAGRYIRARLTQFGSGWRVYAGIYDVGNPRPLLVVSNEIPSDASSAASVYAALADSLLLRGSTRDLKNHDVGSRSLPAVQAVIKGQLALAAWDLQGADAAFQSAIYFDPNYARANLLSAQVRAWRELPRMTWAPLAERAASHGSQLEKRERELAIALSLLGHADFQRACDAYQAVSREYPKEFAAHFGLGQCRTLDRVVVADRRSPSGWRFRSSVGRAMKEFKIAFEELPAFTNIYESGAFERLRNLLIVSNDMQPGYGQSDSSLFYARPGWLNDSLVMVPYPWPIFFAGDSVSIPPGFTTALRKRRDDFREIATKWLSDFPKNSNAQQLFAISLEMLEEPGAVDTIRAARDNAIDSLKKGELAAKEAVLLVKFGVPTDLPLLRRARQLADSLMARGVPAEVSAAEVFSPLYALLGRCNQLDSAARRMTPIDGSNRMGSSVVQDANVLGAMVALGCELRDVTISSVASAISRNYAKADASERQRIDEMLLYRPVVMAPRLDPNITARLARGTHDELLIAANAIALGDSSSARASLLKVDKRVSPGIPTPDITLARARLWLSAGDSVQAARTLDSALGFVKSYDPDVLTDPVNTAALMRAMLLRANIAAKRGDPATDRRWRTVVEILWANADPKISAEVETRSH